MNLKGLGVNEVLDQIWDTKSWRPTWGTEGIEKRVKKGITALQSPKVVSVCASNM